jgi:hypothetical protein
VRLLTPALLAACSIAAAVAGAPGAAQQGVSLAPPSVGDVRLTVLAPEVLEVSVVSSPADATAPDPLLSLPSGASGLSVRSGDRTLRVVRSGARRRVAYAPLAARDLRVETVLFLEVTPPVLPGRTVEVSGGPWGAKRLVAAARPDRVSPAIHVSQAGYVSGLPKRAQVGYYLGTLGELRVGATRFVVERVSDGGIALEGSLAARPDRGFPGSPPPYQHVLEANLDRLDQPGLVLANLKRHFPFSRGDHRPTLATIRVAGRGVKPGDGRPGTARTPSRA